MSIHTILSQMEFDFDRKFPNLGLIDGVSDNGDMVEYETNEVIKSFFRSFATRIVEEVGKELIGQDEKYYPSMYKEDIVSVGERNQFRHEQRTKLQKMKG